jgi:hypothetical protein
MIVAARAKLSVVNVSSKKEAPHSRITILPVLLGQRHGRNKSIN